MFKSTTKYIGVRYHSCVSVDYKIHRNKISCMCLRRLQNTWEQDIIHVFKSTTKYIGVRYHSCV